MICISILFIYLNFIFFQHIQKLIPLYPKEKAEKRPWLQNREKLHHITHMYIHSTDPLLYTNNYYNLNFWWVHYNNWFNVYLKFKYWGQFRITHHMPKQSDTQAISHWPLCLCNWPIYTSTHPVIPCILLTLPFTFRQLSSVKYIHIRTTAKK